MRLIVRKLFLYISIIFISSGLFAQSLDQAKKTL